MITVQDNLSSLQWSRAEYTLTATGEQLTQPLAAAYCAVTMAENEAPLSVAKAGGNDLSTSSAAATLTVGGIVTGGGSSITAQPTNQSIATGATATFSVVAGGTAPFTYQWSKNGAIITGATGASYTTPATVTTDNGSTFNVVITNAGGSVYFCNGNAHNWCWYFAGNRS